MTKSLMSPELLMIDGEENWNKKIAFKLDGK